MRIRPTLLALPALLALGAVAAPADAGTSAPSLATNYVVVLDDALSDAGADAIAATAESLGADLGFTYRHALTGFSARIPALAVPVLRALPGVTRVERDQVFRASTTQTGATYGIDRVDQRALPLSGTYSYTATGAGVNAYIVDTGIRTTHSDFGGRARSGFDAVTAGGTAADCNGHGTHVAGTVGGATWGIAKGASLIAVRVLDCDGSGTTAGIVAGIDWIIADHDAGEAGVANLSLSGGANTTLDNAVKRGIADGVTFALAAGNGNALGFAENACNISPARVPDAITVGATDRTDRKASFSNNGPCVDLFAPGVDVISASSADDTSSRPESGTSMSAPHVAGAAALALQGRANLTPKQVRDELYAKSTKGVVTNAGGGLFGGGTTANNHLLFVDY